MKCYIVLTEPAWYNKTQNSPADEELIEGGVQNEHKYPSRKP